MSADEAESAAAPWWDDLDAAALACLRARGAMAPQEVGHQLGLSEAAAASLLCLLALEGRVRICLVEPAMAQTLYTRAA